MSEKSWNSAAAKQEGAGDPRLSRAVFEKIAVPSRAVAFRDEHILVAVKMFPDLRGAADALEAARQVASADLDAGMQRVFLASVHAKLLERLSAGEIIDAHPLDRPAQDDSLDDPRYQRRGESASDCYCAFIVLSFRGTSLRTPGTGLEQTFRSNLGIPDFATVSLRGLAQGQIGIRQWLL